MKKHYKKIGIYIVGMAILLGYLFNANQIVAKTLLADSVFEKVDFDSIPSTSVPQYCLDVDGIEYIGGAFEFVFIQGWAFCETEQPNDEKEINIVLRNLETGDAYSCATIPQYRPDVYAAFKDSRNIMGEYHGITAKIATYMLPNNTYELLVNVVENENDYGLISTNMYFIKTFEDFIAV